MNLKLIFSNFDDPLIAHLSRVGEIVFIPAGELLFRPGQYFKNTILVLEGSIKMYLEGRRDEELFLYFLEPGSACALSIIYSGSPKNDVKAKAVTDARVLMIPFQHMDDLIKTHTKWCYFLLDTYHTRFQELLLTIDQLVFNSLEQKLEFYLRQQFDGMRSSTITITHQEIATDLNSSREVISRLLKKLELGNRISISRNEITNISL